MYACEDFEMSFGSYSYLKEHADNRRVTEEPVFEHIASRTYFQIVHFNSDMAKILFFRLKEGLNLSNALVQLPNIPKEFKLYNDAETLMDEYPAGVFMIVWSRSYSLRYNGTEIWILVNQKQQAPFPVANAVRKVDTKTMQQDNAEISSDDEYQQGMLILNSFGL